MKITRVETDLFRLPLPRPVPMPGSQDPRPVSHVEVVVVRLLTDTPQVGIGFADSFGGGAAVRAVIDTQLSAVAVGEDPLHTEWLWARMRAELEGTGFGGPAARACAAVDLAAWDVKGKALGSVPVYQLLGGYRTRMKAVTVGVATPAVGLKQAVRDCKVALDQGSAGIQIDVGTQDPDLDYDRLRQLRDEIPDGAWFEVNAGGRYDFATAVWLGTVGAEELGVDGFGDPLRADDVNLRRLTDRLNVGVSVGGFLDRVEDFTRVIDAGGIESVRIDPIRLGGLTPARKVALAAELKQVAIYPVRVAEVGTHLGAGCVYGRMCEHTDWFAGLFAGGPQFANGQLCVSDAPGLGLSLKDDANQWRIG
ncbi:MAG: mandelate racemase/muconate lactonizing enzyme family protein [Fimbriiglobus sp.]|jgi:L-alanine-DL-glutamate epimerase-like enolase superfamily enzyme|nr:mandelate racemase/muconate lactonizing enzyme family protein [Fimbriiglobus sp.]